MKLASLLKEENVIVNGEAQSLPAAILALLETMPEDLGGNDLGALAAQIIEHESDHPTVVGDGVWIAHLRSASIKQFRLGLDVPREPLRHPSGAAEKLRMIFLVLAPQDQNTLMLQTVAAITRLTATRTFGSAVKGVKSAPRLLRLLEESGVDVKRNLCAADIMEPVKLALKMDAPIPEAVAALANHRDEGLPVVDERGRLTGEITTREILQLGMPKYMDLLANPEMLNAFEPFENYFLHAHEMKVRDICRRDYGWVPPQTPIVQVAHLMIRHNRRRVYVLDEGSIEGVIYRKSILLRVMTA